MHAELTAFKIHGIQPEKYFVVRHDVYPLLHLDAFALRMPFFHDGVVILLS